MSLEENLKVISNYLKNNPLNNLNLPIAIEIDVVGNIYLVYRPSTSRVRFETLNDLNKCLEIAINSNGLNLC